jgi:hypothetical protein
MGEGLLNQNKPTEKNGGHTANTGIPVTYFL